MKKRVLALLLSVCMTVTFAACSETQSQETKVSAGESNPGSTGVQADKVTGVKEGAKSMKDGINDFSFRLYDALPKNENCFYSPYSLCSALSMLNLGADGETGKELESTLGIADVDVWNQKMQTYLSK